MIEKFIYDRRNNWEKLESLLNELDKLPLRKLPREQIRELGWLYQRVTADLAIARAESNNPRVISYLNSLAIRAHGKIYRTEHEILGTIKKFYLEDFPKTFRETFNYTLFAFIVFMTVAIISFFLAYTDHKFVQAADLEWVRGSAANNQKWWESINPYNQLASSQIMTNNIMVAFRAFAYGAFLGFGSIYILALNAMLIGGVFGVCYATNPAFGNELATFVVGHGVIELSCIFIAGGAGTMIGHSIIAPGDLKRIDALKKAGVKTIRLVFGCASLLVVAGIIEGFISPSSLPAWFKYLVGISTGIAMYSYLFLVGKDKNSSSTPSTITKSAK
ncbi:MAG: stage II sporulation protein M [Acidobacteria bacterium]|jgi:uncharacterized membrane protein SpoIIM required for sporulation|nr:MAG: stage II sporulation protein M [Acidobacteriota bacterium]GIU82182.1 MAG: hypothetical protein KatS3mg006_1246 [Pyrinomonadaceae bacterium]